MVMAMVIEKGGQAGCTADVDGNVTDGDGDDVETYFLF